MTLDITAFELKASNKHFSPYGCDNGLYINIGFFFLKMEASLFPDVELKCFKAKRSDKIIENNFQRMLCAIGYYLLYVLLFAYIFYGINIKILTYICNVIVCN